MKKFKLITFIFVFWWSILCPPLGFPEDSVKVESSQSINSVDVESPQFINSIETDSSQAVVPSEPEIHFQFKYLTFLNYLFD